MEIKSYNYIKNILIVIFTISFYIFAINKSLNYD
jgi:hypothetical protein